jgi:type III restriction enzyme
MEKQLQLPDQLACSVDQATGTGKSYVLYGLAMILLAEGAVDRVLVLCPSNTIEDGLLKSSRNWRNSDRDACRRRSSDAEDHNARKASWTARSAWRTTTRSLENTKSSIRESLKARRARGC